MRSRYLGAAAIAVLLGVGAGVRAVGAQGNYPDVEKQQAQHEQNVEQQQKRKAQHRAQQQNQRERQAEKNERHAEKLKQKNELRSEGAAPRPVPPAP